MGTERLRLATKARPLLDNGYGPEAVRKARVTGRSPCDSAGVECRPEACNGSVEVHHGGAHLEPVPDRA
jgi:hypothetical protein